VAAAPAFLIIQTAFIGDVVLATALAEKLHDHQPEASIDFLVRKGNEDLLKRHPFLRNVIVWDKKKGKLKILLRLIRQVRATRYDYVIDVHRFASSGLITALSGARVTVGFDKNPLSRLFTKSKPHTLARGVHEVQRNQTLIAEITNEHALKPRLYPSKADEETIMKYRLRGGSAIPYLCIAPASVWFTKQFPKEKWITFIDQLEPGMDSVYLLGAPSDREYVEAIRSKVKHPGVVNLSGTLSFLESAALMHHAVMNFVNDSAPLHLASSVNAPVTAVFCSTVPDFGFGPLSERSFIVETTESLTCRPCGLHGFRSCPQGHFKCALTITNEQLLMHLKFKI
jgi:heptosyltransferase-2